jgi:hypothetical protein
MIRLTFRDVAIVLCIWMLSDLSTVHAQDRYFVLIFGSQSRLNRPSRSHTWATIVKASADGTRLEQLTISWLPQAEKVRILTLRGEPGINLDLHTTISRYQQLNGSVSLWGPYETAANRGPVLFERAASQIERLNSGTILYKAIDPNLGPRKPYLVDCIHAITDLDQDQSRNAYSELLRFGDRASEYIVRELDKRGRIQRQHREDWVMDALGLRKYSITVRQ